MDIVRPIPIDRLLAERACPLFVRFQGQAGPGGSHRLDTAKLGDLRGAPFLRNIKSTIITREAYIKGVQQDLQVFTPAVDRFYSRELSQIGFFPDTLLSLKKLYGDFESGFPAGYYVPGTDSIYILSEYINNTRFLDVALPHELTHAWQDQILHGLGRADGGGSPVYYGEDINFNRTCLIEGDAEFTATAYVARYTEGDSQPFINSLEKARERKHTDFLRWKEDTLPKSMFTYRTSPYYSGMAMVAETYSQDGNWNAVNALYGAPGQPSRTVLTRQNLSPETVDFSGVYAALDTAGAHIDDAALGSMQLMQLFIPYITEDVFLNGMGWRGDRLTYVKKDGNAFGTLVWVQLYDDAAAAQFAYEGLSGLLPKRFRKTTYEAHLNSAIYPGDFDQTLTLVSDGLSSVLIRKGRQVWWVENAGDRIDRVVAALDSQPVVLAKTLAMTAGPRPGGESLLFGPHSEKWFFRPPGP